MQVFLPYPDFEQSVQCLDPYRLGNQIWRECKTLLNGGWPHHPVAKMWADYRTALASYTIQGLHELLRRQAIDPHKYENHSKYFWSIFRESIASNGFRLPPFYGNEEFHRSHRLNLLWKGQQDVLSGRSSTNWYASYFSEPAPTSKPDYIWPTPEIDRSHVGS